MLLIRPSVWCPQIKERLMSKREKLIETHKKFITTMKELDDALDQYEKELTGIMQELLREIGCERKLKKDSLFMRGGVHCGDWKIEDQNYLPLTDTKTDEDEVAFLKAISNVSEKFYRKTKVRIMAMGTSGIVYMPKKRSRRT